MFGEPPDLVPDDLSAEEYLELGIWYQQSKMFEQARESLQRTIKLAAEGDTNRRARQFLSENIPAKENSKDVIASFREIELTGMSSPGRADKKFKELIKDHPDFEWPYRSLAESTCRRVGDLENAIGLLEEALRINPHYIAGLVTMAEAMLADMEYDKARVYLDRVRVIAADHAPAINLRRTLEILVAYEK